LKTTRSRISVAEILPSANKPSCSRQYADGCPPSISVMAIEFRMLFSLEER
jgi:hypothetical protein